MLGIVIPLQDCQAGDTGWSPSQTPFPIKGEKAEARKKLHTDLIPPHQSTHPAAMKYWDTNEAGLKVLVCLW